MEFLSNSWEILSCFCQSFVSLCIWQNFFHNWQKIFCCWQNCFSGWQNFFRIWQNTTHVLDWFDRIPQKCLKSIKIYKTPIQMIILKKLWNRNFVRRIFQWGHYYRRFVQTNYFSKSSILYFENHLYWRIIIKNNIFFYLCIMHFVQSKTSKFLFL